MKEETLLMLFEVVYLWRALPNCSKETKEKIIEMLEGMCIMCAALLSVCCLSLLLVGCVLVCCAFVNYNLGSLGDTFS